MPGELCPQYNKLQMKKIIPVVLAIFLIINLYGLYLLKDSYDSSQENIKSSILQELENRRQIEESVKRELDSKKQAKDFILQRDYEKALEELTLQIEENQNLIVEYSNANQQQASDLSETIARLSSRLKESEQGLNQLRQEPDQREAADKEFDSRLQSLEKKTAERINMLAATLEDQLQSFGKQLTEQSIRLDQLKEKGPGAGAQMN